MAERVWTVRDALDWTRAYLDDKSIEQPRVSAEWLLSAATGLSRVELYTQLSRPLSLDERDVLREAVRRRATGEPLQYVTGEMPFRHVVVHVCEGVFIPRPETEVLVDVALGHLGAGSPVATGPQSVREPATVVDLCTGAGPVALSLAYEAPQLSILATELSEASVDVTCENAERLGVADRVEVLLGDLFDPLPDRMRGSIAAVVSNPPYIPTADVEALPAEVLGFEPHLALDGGPDGLDVARRIMSEAREWLAPGGLLAMELDARRVEDAANEMRRWYEGVRTVPDLAGRARIVAGVRR